MYTNRKMNIYDDVFGIENFTNWDDERSEEFFGLDFGGAVLLGICALVVFCFVVLIKGELTHAKNLKEFYMRNKEAIDGLYLKLKRENLYKQYHEMCEVALECLRKRNMYQMDERDFPAYTNETMFYNKVFNQLKYWIFQTYQVQKNGYRSSSSVFESIFTEALLLHPKDVNEDMFVVEFYYDEETGKRMKIFKMKRAYMQKLADGLMEDLQKAFKNKYTFFRMHKVNFSNDGEDTFNTLQDAKEELMITGNFHFCFDMKYVFDEIGDKLV